MKHYPMLRGNAQHLSKSAERCSSKEEKRGCDLFAAPLLFYSFLYNVIAVFIVLCRYLDLMWLLGQLVLQYSLMVLW